LYVHVCSFFFLNGIQAEAVATPHFTTRPASVLPSARIHPLQGRLANRLYQFLFTHPAQFAPLSADCQQNIPSAAPDGLAQNLSKKAL
jgi:hypothetical protein